MKAVALAARHFAGCLVGKIQPGFEIPNQVFIRIDLWRIRRKIKDFNPILSLGQPCGDELGMMHLNVFDCWNNNEWGKRYENHANDCKRNNLSFAKNQGAWSNFGVRCKFL